MRGSWRWVGLWVALMVAFLGTPTSAKILEHLAATQSLGVEYAPATGELSIMGMLVLDLATGPRWSWSYVYGRGWFPEGVEQDHDVYVTRHWPGDRTGTLGVRLKIPEGGPNLFRLHFVVSWPWGK